MDLLVSLYFTELEHPRRGAGVARTGPLHPLEGPRRDRPLLRPGPARLPPGLPNCSTFDKGDSRLQGHPDVTRLPGLDSSTGSLGQGLSVGVGMALGARLAKKDFHTWVMLGDGEIQEGMSGKPSSSRPGTKLANLTAIVDATGCSSSGCRRRARPPAPTAATGATPGSASTSLRCSRPSAGE